MNATEKARRSDSLYFGEISRRELCNMVSNLESDMKIQNEDNVRMNDELRNLFRDVLRYYSVPNEIDYKLEADLLERAHKLGIEATE